QKITEFNIYESRDLDKINSKMSLCIDGYHTLEKIYIEGMIVHISNLKRLKDLKLIKCMGTEKIPDFNIGKIEKCPNLDVIEITHNMSNYVIKDTVPKTLKLIISGTEDITEQVEVDNLDMLVEHNYIF